MKKKALLGIREKSGSKSQKVRGKGERKKERKRVRNKGKKRIVRKKRIGKNQGVGKNSGEWKGEKVTESIYGNLTPA